MKFSALNVDFNGSSLGFFYIFKTFLDTVKIWVVITYSFMGGQR